MSLRSFDFEHSFHKSAPNRASGHSLFSRFHNGDLRLFDPRHQDLWPFDGTNTFVDQWRYTTLLPPTFIYHLNMIAAIVTIATLVVHLIFLGRFLYRVVWLGLDFVEDDDDENENATTDESLEETKDGHLALVISRLINTTIENSHSALKEHMDLQTTRMDDICHQLSALDKKTANLQPVPVKQHTERTATFDIASLIDHKLDSFNSALRNHASLQTARMDDICRQLSALETKSSTSQRAKQGNENDEHDARTLDVADIDDVQKPNMQDMAPNKGREDIMSKLSSLEEKFYTLRQEELSHSKDQVADLLVANDKTLAATIREHEQKNTVALKDLEAKKDALLATKDHQLQITLYLLRQQATALEQARFEYTKLDVFQTAEHTKKTVECAIQTVESATKTAQRSTNTAECTTQTTVFAVQTTDHDFVTTKLSNELSKAWGVIDQCEQLFQGLNAEVDTLKKDMKEAGKILVDELVPQHQDSHNMFKWYLHDVLHSPLLKRRRIWWPEDGPRSERLEELAQYVECKIETWEEEGEDEITGGVEAELSVDEEARSPSTSSESGSGSETSARSDASSYTSPASSYGGDAEQANESERPESPIPYRPTSPDYHFTEATASSLHTSYGEGIGLHYDYGTGASYEDQVPYPRSESPPFDPEEDPNAMDEGSDSPYRPTSPDYCYAASTVSEDSTSYDESSKLDERPESPMSCRPSSPAYEPAPTVPEDSASSSPAATSSDEGFGARTSDDHPSTFTFAFTPTPSSPTASGRTNDEYPPPSTSPFTPEGLFSRPAFVPPTTYPSDWWQTPGASTSTYPTPPPFSAQRTRDPRARARPQDRPVRELPKRRGKEKERA